MSPFVNGRKSSSSDTDCTDVASTPASTQDVPEASTRTVPCGVRDEPVAPGACFPSPQPSPWRQLCSEMQQVDVDQHSHNLGLPGRFQQLDLQLSQVQNQRLAGGRHTISTYDRVPDIQQGMHSASTTPITQGCDALIASDSSKLLSPSVESSQSCSSPGGGDLSTVTAVDQQPNVVLHGPHSVAQVLHRPSHELLSTCHPATYTAASSSCRLLESSNSDKPLHTSQVHSRSNERETGNSGHESPSDQGGSCRKGGEQGRAVPFIHIANSDCQLPCCAGNTTEIARAEEVGQHKPALTCYQEPRLDSEIEEHSGVADAVLAELVSDAACMSCSEGTVSHSKSHSSCSGMNPDIDANTEVRNEGCRATELGRSSSGHRESAPHCAEEYRDDSPSGCQPRISEQLAFGEQASNGGSSAALPAVPACNTAAPVLSLLQAGSGAYSDTVANDNLSPRPTTLPSNAPESSLCPISAAADAAAEQPISTAQPSTEQPGQNPPAAEPAPHQSVTISAGCLSDMTSMMDPGRGTTPLAAQSDRLARNAPPSLLIAQSNPLYNSSPDTEGGNTTPVQSYQDPPLSTPCSPQGCAPQRENESVAGDNESLQEPAHLTKSLSEHRSRPSFDTGMPGGNEPTLRQLSTAAVNINRIETETDVAEQEASSTFFSPNINAVNTCASSAVHDIRDTVHDPDLLDHASQYDAGLFQTVVPPSVMHLILLYLERSASPILHSSDLQLRLQEDILRSQAPLMFQDLQMCAQQCC